MASTQLLVEIQESDDRVAIVGQKVVEYFQKQMSEFGVSDIASLPEEVRRVKVMLVNLSDQQLVLT